ncbi:hypothetical protein HN419_06770 [Candidatus Woesearchaeota archaeon]|jgi:hypothetical protein|nr:hypothetical protein [Candidatus Woesearchaeota archaeon]MBT7929470.1 hypothetical protein [Candidatus Peregrinibacteria bacterium]MBT3538198.1 hypothetical protein [Candidatus Woesearchaeota archaeon]MBT4698458.1 hypothetical protein [Candidatus Woesearchaeota archaeon]MBT4717152.1 hypothetical protein [Candidatus Woesearchaeota archaeon]
MLQLIPLIIGTIIGFITAKLLSGRKEGEQGILKSLKFKINNKTIHLHHWIISLTILIVLTILNYNNNIIDGLLIGITLQGITYKDFLKIIY